MKSIGLLIFLVGLHAMALTDSKANGAKLLHRFVNPTEFNYADLVFQFSVVYEPKADGSPGDDLDAFGILYVTGKDKKTEKRMYIYPGSEPEDFKVGTLCLRADLERNKSTVLQLKLYKLSCLKK